MEPWALENYQATLGQWLGELYGAIAPHLTLEKMAARTDKHLSARFLRGENSKTSTPPPAKQMWPNIQPRSKNLLVQLQASG